MLSTENFDTSKRIYYTSGNAYKMVDGQLWSAPLFVDGSIDETCWCEVMEESWDSQRITLFFAQYEQQNDVVYNCHACGELKVVYKFNSYRKWWVCKDCLSNNKHRNLTLKIVRREQNGLTEAPVVKDV